MSKQTINLGTAANSKSGDPLRTAFTKVNENFTELYNLSNADVQIPPQNSNNGKYLRTTGSSLLFDYVSYTNLIDKPALFSGSYNDLSNKPMIFSGSYTDLTNKPNTITIDALKTLVATSTDFADFKTRIAAL